MDKTPRGNRKYIGIFGVRNAGKSSLLNAITDQEIALVSPHAGTTTDPVLKNMEIPGIGPVVFLDTAGFDDEGDLGALRVQKTEDAIQKCDLALLLLTPEGEAQETEWFLKLRKADAAVVPVVTKTDVSDPDPVWLDRMRKLLGAHPVPVSAVTREGIDTLLDRMRDALVGGTERTITGRLTKEKMRVLLILPIDIQAPKGRLILPQVQTIRELLDKKCIVIACTFDEMDEALAALSAPPDLIITDSQVFHGVLEKKPDESLLTSFSVLFAAQKGDLPYFLEGCETLRGLTEDSRVLIAEACTHPPLEEDIGRIKIPALLRKRTGPGLTVDFVRGDDFPEDPSHYDLIIHCGACLFTRKHVLSRVERAKRAGVPMTNYGVTIACLHDMIDSVALP